MQGFVDGLVADIKDNFVFPFAPSNVRSVSDGAKTRRNVVCAAKNSHCARLPDLETSGVHFAWRFPYISIQKKRVKIWKTLEHSKDFWGADENLIGTVIAREIMVLKHASKAALAVDSSIAESRDPSNDMIVTDSNEKAGGISSAKATLSKGSAKTGDKNAFKKDAAHFFRVK